MLNFNDINHVYKDSTVFSIVDQKEHCDVTVVTQKGDLKKASAEIVSFELLKDVSVLGNDFYVGEVLNVLKINYLSEYKFFPTVFNSFGSLFNIQLNPSYFFSVHEVLKTNIQNAPLIDAELMYTDTCLILLNVGR